MDNLFQNKQTLLVSIGEGFLSAYEAGSLKKGDVVRTSQIAGEPYRLFFNGRLMGFCEIVVLDGLWGVRLVSRQPEPVREPVPAPGDDPAELLPVTVSLGSIRISLAELQSAGPGSYISLGEPFQTTEDADLLVFGMKAARGKVCVLGEYMGIRILEVGDTAYSTEILRSTGYLLTEREAEKAKDYDFLRPDRFTYAAILRMREIHSHFLKALGLRSGKLSGHQVEFVDQCTYGEFVSSIRKDDFGYLLIRNDDWEREPLRVRHGSARIRVVEEKESRNPLGGDVKEALLKSLSANGNVQGKPVILCHRRELAALDTEYVSACLRGAWRNIVDLNLKAVKVTERFDELPEIGQNEMIILVKFAGTADREIYVVYPYPFLESLLGLLK